MSSKLDKLIKKAETLRSQNKLAESLDIYKSICSLDKKNPNTWLIYGSIAGNVGRLDIAETAFRNACKLHKVFGKHNELLIQILEMQGKHSEAITMLINLSTTTQAPKDIALRIGVLYGKTEEFEKSIEWINKFISAGHDSSFAQHCLASAYESCDMFVDAKKHFQAAITLNNNDHVILNNYASLLQKTGDIDASIEVYNQSIKVNNQYPISQYNLADILLTREEYEDALLLFTNAVKLKPDFIEAIIGQARCYQQRGANLYALQMYDKALAIDSSLNTIYLYISQIHSKLGNFDKALEALRNADRLNPNDIVIQCSIAELYEKRGLYKDAEDIIRPLIKTDCHNYSVVMVYASLCKKLAECDSAIELINNTISTNSVPKASKISLHYRAGKILDGLKRYNDAFNHYLRANIQQDYKYESKLTHRSYNNITTLFSKESLETLPRCTVKTINPIFIVGMPRSGTTLVEQIISSLPDVYGAGELSYLLTVSRQIAGDFLPGKECITTFTNLDQTHLNTLAQQYVQSALSNTDHRSFFTDKMPHNFALIGLINILFPNAKIIHCKRNPIDTCLSIFFSEFNSRHAYASNLENLATYYTSYYEALMSHWYEVSKVPIYEISYEDIVNDQENTSRKLIDYCGFEWDEQCLDFYKSIRNVATISYDQVRQPIYKHSVERWRNYEQYIKPLLEHFKEYV